MQKVTPLELRGAGGGAGAGGSASGEDSAYNPRNPHHMRANSINNASLGDSSLQS